MKEQAALEEAALAAKIEKDRCPLCERSGCIMTDHHLIPAHKGGKAEHKHSVCKECHKQIHAVYTNDELAAFYNTVEKLQEATELQPFYRFIKKQNPLKRIRFRQSRRRRMKINDPK